MRLSSKGVPGIYKYLDMWRLTCACGGIERLAWLLSFISGQDFLNAFFYLALGVTCQEAKGGVEWGLLLSGRFRSVLCWWDRREREGGRDGARPKEKVGQSGDVTFKVNLSFSDKESREPSSG